MSAAAYLLAILTQASAVPTPSPLFEAFKAPCASVASFDALGKAALVAGWTQVAEKDADPRIAAIVGKGRAAMMREEPTSVMTGDLFRRTIDSRTVYLATSRVTMKIDGKLWSGNGCRAYDLDALAPVPTRTLTSWVGAPPTSIQGNGGAVKALWQPWQAGATLEITYVPRSHPLGTQFGIQGLVLVSQAIGGPHP